MTQTVAPTVSAPGASAITPRPRPRARVALAALGLAGALAVSAALSGCSGSLATGTAGDEGTIDLNAAKKAAETNPEIAKAAARRGGMGGAQTKKSAK